MRHISVSHGIGGKVDRSMAFLNVESGVGKRMTQATEPAELEVEKEDLCRHILQQKEDAFSNETAVESR